MTRPTPSLGSEWLRNVAPSTPHGVEDLSPALCTNMSQFKSLIRQYRSIDDAIMTRLNRAQALYRQDHETTYRDRAQADECQSFWTDLMETWKGRETAIRYCVGQLDARAEEKRRLLGSESDARLDGDKTVRASLYSDEVKRQQVHNELQIESVVRRRTLSAFFSRCPGFERLRSIDTDLEPIPLMHREPIG